MKMSNLEVAYQYLQRQAEPVSFVEIWEYVCEEKKYTSEERDSLISNFYTNLSLDGRFVQSNENTWTLRSRVKFEEIKKALNSVYADEDLKQEDDVIVSDEDNVDEDETIVEEEESEEESE